MRETVTVTFTREKIDSKSLPYFRDIPVGARFRLFRFRKTLWIKTEPVQPPEANHIMYNCVAADGSRKTKIGWNAKVILESEGKNA